MNVWVGGIRIFFFKSEKNVLSVHLPKTDTLIMVNSDCIAMGFPKILSHAQHMSAYNVIICRYYLTRRVQLVLYPRCPFQSPKVPFQPRKVPLTKLWDAVKIRKNIPCPNHTPSFIAIRPAVPEIRTRGAHVRTCTCNPYFCKTPS